MPVIGDPAANFGDRLGADVDHAVAEQRAAIVSLPFIGAILPILLNSIHGVIAGRRCCELRAASAPASSAFS